MKCSVVSGNFYCNEPEYLDDKKSGRSRISSDGEKLPESDQNRMQIRESKKYKYSGLFFCCFFFVFLSTSLLLQKGLVF